jgi:chromosome segregation ATPase
MQLNEVKQRFSRVEQCIDDATEACEQSLSAPQQLKESIRQLDQRSEQARQYIQGQDESQIRQCINELEELSDRAMQACEQSGSSIDPQLQQAVQQTHSELSSLKHQMG